MLYLNELSWLFTLEDEDLISCKSICRDQIWWETGQGSHNRDRWWRKSHKALCYWHRNGDLKAILELFWASNIYTCVKRCVCVWPNVCAGAKASLCVLVRLCGRLPALSHIIADSVVYRGGGREPDTAPPFGSHTHTHTLHQPRQKAYLTRSGRRKGDEGWRKRWSKWALLISQGFILRIFQIIPEQMSWSYGVLG